MNRQILRAAVAAATIAFGAGAVAWAQTPAAASAPSPGVTPSPGQVPGGYGYGPGMMGGAYGPAMMGGGYGPGARAARGAPGWSGPVAGGPGAHGAVHGGYGGYGGYGCWDGHAGMGSWMAGGYGAMGPSMMGGYGAMGPWMMGGAGWGAGASMTGPGWQRFGSLAALDLSAAQRRKIDSIMQAQFKRQWTLIERMHTHMLDLWRTTDGTSIDVDATMKVATAMADIRLAMLRNRLDARKRMLAVLSDAQRQQLRRMAGAGGW